MEFLQFFCLLLNTCHFEVQEQIQNHSTSEYSNIIRSMHKSRLYETKETTNCTTEHDSSHSQTDYPHLIHTPEAWRLGHMFCVAAHTVLLDFPYVHADHGT